MGIGENSTVSMQKGRGHLLVDIHIFEYLIVDRLTERLVVDKSRTLMRRALVRPDTDMPVSLSPMTSTYLCLSLQ